MRVSARVENRKGSHAASVSTSENERSLSIPPKPGGFGSSVNGGELLFLALATCYCNDIYREAKKRGIEIAGVEVEVRGEFGAEGEPARNIRYSASIATNADAETVKSLMLHTDAVAEIQNTLRTSCPITLEACEVRSSV